MYGTMGANKRALLGKQMSGITYDWKDYTLPPSMILSVFQYIFGFSKIVFPKNESHVTFQIEILPTAFLANFFHGP